MEPPNHYKINTYIKDSRYPLEILFAKFDLLSDNYGWKKEILCTQEFTDESGINYQIDVPYYRTQITGDSLWILAGVHGEEPAGPNALADNIPVLAQLGLTIPIVIFPLCNPGGYSRNWRFNDLYREVIVENFDSATKLTALKSQEYTYRSFFSSQFEPSNNVEEYAIYQQIIELKNTYQPLLVVNHHEDEFALAGYIYSQGYLGREDQVAERVLKILKKAGVVIKKNGLTRFDEKILSGMVASNDGSLDELFAAETVLFNNAIIPGPCTPSVIVIETPITEIPLKKRIKYHSAVIHEYGHLYNMANSLYGDGLSRKQGYVLNHSEEL